MEKGGEFGYLNNRNLPLLTKDFCLHNGSKNLSKKKKNNQKYYLYNQKTGNRVVLTDFQPFTILQIIELKKNERIVFYVDTKGRISFVKTRHGKYRMEKMLEKIEKTPFFRTAALLFCYHFLFFGVMRVRDYSFKESYLSFGYDKGVNIKMFFLFPLKLREKFSMKTDKLSLLVHTYFCWVPLKKIYQHYVDTSEINTPIFIKLEHSKYNFWYNLKSDSKHQYNNKHYLYNSYSHRLGKLNSELFLRKSITGQYVIVVTSILDRRIIVKEMLAFLFSLFSKNRKRFDLYFEKFGVGASESAFELFKYAHDQGESCIYILDKEYHDFKKLKEQYGNSIVAKNSFKSFYYIFLARSFQSSDLVSHIQRRLYDNDFLIKKKILGTDKKIMLQHGVCMCTNLFERGYFNRKVPIAPDYMIVNSQYEKKLFMDNTGYTEKELMVTGLPNLDLYVKERNSDKSDITFMLTWRPWDLTGSIEPGTYLDRYLSFIDLIRKEAFYKDKKINVVLHPKSKIILQEQFPDIYDQYEPFLYEGDIKDALINSKVLISDYSSVVYYAFAGGSNVVFYWEDKEKAEEQYGAPNILQKEIAFGDIVNNFKELNANIIYNYNNPQSSYHIAKFSKLVECTSGYNTENNYNYIKRVILDEKNQYLENEEVVSFIEKVRKHRSA